MRLLEKPRKDTERSVDDILDEIQKQKPPKVDYDTAKVDSLLSNLGKETAPKPTSVPTAADVEAPAKPPAEAAQPQTPPPSMPDDDAPQQAPVPQETASFSIWDVAYGEDEPRLGKATAIDKIDRDKFTQDTELLSWFEDTELHLSKKEIQQARKDQKAQATADKKARRKRGKRKAKKRPKAPQVEPVLLSDLVTEYRRKEEGDGAAVKTPQPEAPPTKTADEAPSPPHIDKKDVVKKPVAKAEETSSASPRSSKKRKAKQTAVKGSAKGIKPVVKPTVKPPAAKTATPAKAAEKPEAKQAKIATAPPRTPPAKPPTPRGAAPTVPTPPVPAPPQPPQVVLPITAVLPGAKPNWSNITVQPEQTRDGKMVQRPPQERQETPPLAAPLRRSAAEEAPGVSQQSPLKPPATKDAAKPKSTPSIKDKDTPPLQTAKGAEMAPQAAAIERAVKAKIEKPASAHPLKTDKPAEEGASPAQDKTETPKTAAPKADATEEKDAAAERAALTPEERRAELEKRSRPDTSTKTYAVASGEKGEKKVPTAAFTQEFDREGHPILTSSDDSSRSMFVNEMVDDQFRDFFKETVMVDRGDITRSLPKKRKQRRPKDRPKEKTATRLTGEFARVAETLELEIQAEEEAGDAIDDFSDVQDAQAIETELAALRASLSRRSVVTAVLAALLIWLAAGYASGTGLPAFIDPVTRPLLFIGGYLALIVVAVVINFTTVATGLIGVFSQPTSDTPPALATVAVLLQGIVLLVQTAFLEPVNVTLFGGLAVLILAFNAFGKRVRANTILGNFQRASVGDEHCAGYLLDTEHDVARNITKGLAEENPAMLISRPTNLVKGFLRQSFSMHWSDVVARVLGWLLLGVSLVVGVVSYVNTKELYTAITAFAAVYCIAAPLSSTLVSALPSALMQRGAARVGAVIPGWSAVEELGRVNVVMAEAKDLFPSGTIRLRGIKTYERERIDLAILYAASVLIEGCDTLRDLFLAVIQGQEEMLYPIENLLPEPGHGFSAWIENRRVIVGNRAMLQKFDIEPPALETELEYVNSGYTPLYLAVSGKLFAMFILSYSPNATVGVTLESLVQSGVSLLVTSEDMNVNSEMIESIYQLPQGVVKVLGRRELEMLEPLTSYLPASDGVMTHTGTFSSFIGGLRAAAGCSRAERMAGYVQIASVILGLVFSLMLVFSGGIATMGVAIAVLYQLGWTLLVSALPFARRY